MSVGLLLKAKLKLGLLSRLGSMREGSGKTLERMEKWALEHCADVRPRSFIGKRDEKPTLYLTLHPAAEDVEITILDPETFTASANTSTVGPGYHIFVCEMLHKLGEYFHSTWQGPDEDYCDETGFFHSGEQQHVFAEMAAWLKGVANMFFDGTLRDTDHSVRLALPLDVGFESDGRATTPMGPRNIEWLKKTAENADNGRDFFAWWTPGFNAEYFLGRARASMWVDVRWRQPINDFERETLKSVVDSLRKAYTLDPNLEYPWTEWKEILGFLGEKGGEWGFVTSHPHQDAPAIGYRRRDVTVQLPGHWWITLPGSFSNFLDTDNDALCAEDPPRAIWFSAYRFVDDAVATFEHWRNETLKMEKDMLREEDGFISEAKITPRVEDGRPYFALTSSNACPSGRCVCTIVFVQPEDRDWAIDVWKSLKPPK
jgi:hypothetical protein